MKNLKIISASAVMALLLSACGPAPSDQMAPATGTSAAAAADQPQVEVPATTLIHAEPATLGSCDTSGQVTLSWDVRTAHPQISTIKIYTSGGKLFAHSGASGNIDTGPWVKPGSTFILKNAADESELEQLVIGGPVCNN